MAKTVVGLFDRVDDAHEAVKDLISNGVPRDDISLMANDREGQYARELGVNVKEVGAGAGEKAVKGAGVGAVIGGVAGLLAGLGALTIPGIGPVIAAGPLIAALGGAGIGAATGGIVGALTEAGLPDSDASAYAEGVRRGSTLVVVKAPDETADRAAELMNSHHPVDLGQRVSEWRALNWQGFNEDVESFAFQKKHEPYKEREATSHLDYGPGVRSYLAGKPIASYNREASELDKYQIYHPEDWKSYESRFRAHFHQHFAHAGARYEDYREAYRFGYELGRSPNYSNTTWERVNDYIFQAWITREMGLDWNQYEPAIREGWEVGHMPH